MKKVLALFILVSLNHYVKAQKDSSLVDSLRLEAWFNNAKAKPVNMGIHYTLGAANTDFSFSSILNFASQAFLKDEVKHNIISDINNRMRLGIWQQTHVYYEDPGHWSFGGYKDGFRFSISNQYFTSASAPKQTAELFLFGNKAYEDKTLDIANTTYENWNYSGLHYAYQFKVDSLPMEAEVAIIIGHEYSKYHIDKGNLYTAPLGEYLDADLKYEILETPQTNSQLNFNGIGLAIAYKTTLKLNEKWDVELSASDLGFVYFNKLQKTSLDSTFRFTGASFTNIFELNDSILSHEKSRIGDPIFYSESYSKAVIMPFLVKAQFSQKLKEKYFSTYYGGVQYRYITGYIPKVYAGLKKKWNTIHELNSHLSYGGFNTTAVSLNYKLSFKHYALSIASENILAFAIPSVFTGSTIGAHFQYTF